MKAPETRYAKSRAGSVAYQVIGDGPLDLVFITDWVTNVEVMWEEPSLARFLRRLASFQPTDLLRQARHGGLRPVEVPGKDHLYHVGETGVILDAIAIRSACAIRDSAADIGLTVRAGPHTGECEKLGDKVGGLAVHIGARVAGHAEPGEVLASGRVRASS